MPQNMKFAGLRHELQRLQSGPLLRHHENIPETIIRLCAIPKRSKLKASQTKAQDRTPYRDVHIPVPNIK